MSWWVNFAIRITVLSLAVAMVSVAVHSGHTTMWLYAVPVLGSAHGVLFMMAKQKR